MAKKKYIETPELMWQFFCDYRDLIKSNPIVVVEQKKGSIILPKDFEKNIDDLNHTINLPKQRPLTMEGFQNYLDDQDIITDVTDYFENKQDRYSNYIRICSRVRRVIKQDQIEGGMAGIYNPSITQRLNNLVERADMTSGGDKITDYELTLKI
ncbi:MAG TPA: terminase small subunit [Chitinophagaceae bacterium]